ncbi:MAG: adenosine deaminase family protein [Acidobacteriaceae bacterium]
MFKQSAIFLACLACVLFATTLFSEAQAATAPELRAAHALNAVRGNPLELHALLEDMPKGGELHMHLSGAIYAETFIKDAAEDKLCVNLSTLSFFKSSAMTRSMPPQPVCGEGRVPAASAFTNQKLYDDLVDSFSMRSFVPSAGVSGHDQFFATFSRFGGLSKSHTGEWIDAVAARAATQNEQYLEIMDTPDFSHAAKIANEIGWNPDMRKMRADLLAKGLREEVPVDTKEMEDAIASRNAMEHCGQPNAAPACKVEVRFIYQILRGYPPQQVFAQTLLGFEVIQAERNSKGPHFVGINFVMPEDGYISMRDYHLQMEMLSYLHSLYPKVHITLHAGELAPGMVPPAGLRFHIREAVELAHAERIGHGVDVMYETHPYQLLKEMAAKHIAVEINLTSNAVILGISGKEHPLPEYLKYHVPVALSTDDEGVSRIDLTHEYVRAVEDFGLGYLDLKRMARNSIAHSFLDGESLWAQPDVYTRVVSACVGQEIGAEKPSAKCAAFLKSSDKATQEWELEGRFHTFEAGIR